MLPAMTGAANTYWTPALAVQKGLVWRLWTLDALIVGDMNFDQPTEPLISRPPTGVAVYSSSKPRLLPPGAVIGKARDRHTMPVPGATVVVAHRVEPSGPFGSGSSCWLPGSGRPVFAS